MSDVRLEAELSVNADGVVKGSSQAVGALQGAQSALVDLQNKAGKGLPNIVPSNLTLNLNKLGSEGFANLGKKIGDIKRPVGDASMSLINLGRVAQDAPFGFIGIQNNINPLLESFQALKSQTGSTSLALKAMVGGMMGPAGLGVAVSLITAGITWWVQSQHKAKKEVVATTESLDSLNSTMKAGAQNYAKEASALIILYRAATDVNRVMKDRIDAAEQLKRTFPDAFKNSKTQAILNGEEAKSYDALSKSILRTAYAEAARKKVEESGEKKFLLVDKLDKIRNANINEKKRYNKEGNDEHFSPGVGQVTSYEYTVDDKKRASDIRARKATTAILQEIKNIDDANTKLIDRFITGKDVLNVGKEAPKPAKEKKPKKEKLTEAQKDAEALVKIKQKLSDDLAIISLDRNKDHSDTTYSKTISALEKARNASLEIGSKTGKEYVETLQHEIETTLKRQPIEKTIEKALKVDLKPIELNVKVKIPELPKELKAQQSAIQMIQEGTHDIIKEGMINSLTSLGAGLGDALASGTSVLDALGQTALSSIGGILVQFGQLAIKAGLAAKGIAIALKSLNPVFAIAGGIALVALGSYVSKSASGLASKASSGGGGGGSMPSLPSTFTGGGQVKYATVPSGAGGAMQATTTVKGQDIVIAFNRASKANGRTS